MPRLLKSADELYDKHKRLIYKCIHQYAKDGYADFEDLESLSNEVFARCFRKWKPTEGKFSTLLHTALSNAFKSELAKGKCRLRNETEAFSLLRTDEEIDSTEWLMGFLRVIDKDARQIVAKLFSQEARTRKAPISKKETKDMIRTDITRRTDWTKARVKRAFQNIKVALQA